MHFDIVFLDTTSNKFYDRMTLEKEALGGTEASVIRVAEGLGALGLKVAVIEARIERYFEPIIGQYAFFFHSDDVETMTCKHYIQVRDNTNPQLFSGSKKYIWLHDVAGKGREDTWLPSLIENKIKLIGVSKWHKNNIENVLGMHMQKEPKSVAITHIYNPVPDEIYIDIGTTRPYDQNVLVWMSSPHKGLDKAIRTFRTIRKRNNKLQLVVFNPGYNKIKDIESLSTMPGISIYGSMSCRQVWSIVQKSLCVFYPVQYDETFGCVASEANALGTPLVTYPRAGLSESVSTSGQFVENEDQLIEKVLQWSINGAPRVIGKDEFKQSNVIMDWVGMLAE